MNNIDSENKGVGGYRMSARPDDATNTQQAGEESRVTASDTDLQGSPVALYASREAVLISRIQTVRDKRWERLSETDRWTFIQEIARQLHIILGISLPLPKMEMRNMSFDKSGNIVDALLVPGDPRIGGRYHSTTHTIVINRAQLMHDDPKEILLTIAHEMRHVYQADQCQRYHEGRSADPRAATWAKEFSNPIQPTIDIRRYWEQSIEVDANEYADAFVAQIGL